MDIADSARQLLVRTELLDVSEAAQELLIQYLVKRKDTLLKSHRGQSSDLR